jgi:chromate reductase
MNTPRKVAVVVGSLRKDSFNRKLAHALAKMVPPTLTLEEIEIGNLPLFNQDWEADPPPVVTEFKRRIGAADALLFVTPEYNRSVPGVLKNALDVGSRPYGKSAWGPKPGAVISVSPGAIGGFGANHHLRQSLMYLDVAVLPQPEAYIGGAAKLFDDAGAISNEVVRELLQKFLRRFDDWITHNAAAAAPVSSG